MSGQWGGTGTVCGNSGEKEVKYVGNQMLGAWLEKQVVKSGITYQELAERTGHSETSVDRWFNGKNPPKLPNLIMMCEVFGTCQGRSPRQLVFEALMNVSEMVHAEARWKKKNGCV